MLDPGFQDFIKAGFTLWFLFIMENDKGVVARLTGPTHHRPTSNFEYHASL
jgi:hypothetical protein